ncbi:WhiB family transcriptional regulator [Rhodococcus sp. B50]|uniref:WhiB family transcriptional regulator n=1 Tax=Rhodococcus sp. B50 TaxID=2682847 RepID=UPI0019E7D465|nr:WhiB family transcriptional regulator [Rhodococcus sp. B50]
MTTLATPSGNRPDSALQQWQTRADCRFIDPSIFFPSDDESRGMRQRRERTAKQICTSCPVRIPCRDYALETRERHGIWGGTSEADRRRERHPQARNGRLVPSG